MRSCWSDFFLDGLLTDGFKSTGLVFWDLGYGLMDSLVLLMMRWHMCLLAWLHDDLIHEGVDNECIGKISFYS